MKYFHPDYSVSFAWAFTKDKRESRTFFFIGKIEHLQITY